MKELLFYRKRDGEAPIRTWLESFRDKQILDRFDSRFERIIQGNLGDHKPVGDGVKELAFISGRVIAFTMQRMAIRSSYCLTVATRKPKSAIYLSQKNIGPINSARRKEHRVTDHLKYDDYIREKLADEDYAQGYLEVALEEAENDGNYAAFLMALRRVVEVRGGMADMARATSLNRTSLYKALAENGNPTIETLGAILHSLGLRLSLSRQEPVA